MIQIGTPPHARDKRWGCQRAQIGGEPEWATGAPNDMDHLFEEAGALGRLDKEEHQVNNRADRHGPNQGQPRQKTKRWSTFKAIVPSPRTCHDAFGLPQGTPWTGEVNSNFNPSLRGAPQPAVANESSTRVAKPRSPVPFPPACTRKADCPTRQQTIDADEADVRVCLLPAGFVAERRPRSVVLGGPGDLGGNSCEPDGRRPSNERRRSDPPIGAQGAAAMGHESNASVLRDERSNLTQVQKARPLLRYLLRPLFCGRPLELPALVVGLQGLPRTKLLPCARYGGLVLNVRVPCGMAAGGGCAHPEEKQRLESTWLLEPSADNRLQGGGRLPSPPTARAANVAMRLGC